MLVAGSVRKLRLHAEVKDAHRRNRVIISKSKLSSAVTKVLTTGNQHFTIDSLQPMDAALKHDISDSSTGKLSFP